MYCLVCFNYLVQLYYVWMVQTIQYLYLSLNAFQLVLCELCLFIYFHCYLSLCVPVNCTPHQSVGSPSQIPVKLDPLEQLREQFFLLFLKPIVAIKAVFVDAVFLGVAVLSFPLNC